MHQLTACGRWRGQAVRWRARGPAAAALAVAETRCCYCCSSSMAPCGPEAEEWSSPDTPSLTGPPSERSYVSSRTLKQRFLVFAEPQKYIQAQTEADQEPGPGVDATLWHRSSADIVGGQWPESYVLWLSVFIDWNMIRWHKKKIRICETHRRADMILFEFGDVTGHR